jgi:hypothetical protein
MGRVRRVIKKIFIGLLVLSWLLNSWPKVPFTQFPPKVHDAKAVTCGSGFGTDIGGNVCLGFLTTSDTSPWTVPDDWSSVVSIEVVGGGKGGTTGTTNGIGGAGGDGGGYAKITSFTTSAGSTISFQVGNGGSSDTNGQDTWFDRITGTNTACTSGQQSVCANGGGTGSTRIGSVTAAGGTGNSSTQKGGGGGGGAAGPDTGNVGKNGGQATAPGGAGGGGSDGNSASTGSSSLTTAGVQGGTGYDGTAGGTGGNGGTHGSGGGGGTGVTSGSCNAGTGGLGGNGGTSINFDASHGTGGGAGGGGGSSGTGGSKGNACNGGNGGNYGGGGGGGGGTGGNATSGGTGGSGGNGIIVIKYNISAASSTYTQNHFRWYVDSGSENVTDPWSSTASIDVAEDTGLAITPVAYDPPSTTQELRLRISLTVSTANLSASAERFKLQYRRGSDSDCSATGEGWTDVNSGNAWTYTSSTGVTDGTTLTASKLTGTNVLEVYARSRPSALNPNSATTTQNIEYDFHIVGTNSASATKYLFRVVKTDAAGTASTALTSYTNCPTLVTEPGTDNFMRHGQTINEFSGSNGFYWAK